MNSKFFALIATVLFAFANVSHASIVYDNGGPAQDSTRCISGPNACGGSGSWTDYGSFTLSNATTINGFYNWVTGSLASNYLSTNWSIWSKTPSNGGTALYSGNAVGTAATDGAITKITLDSLSLTLAAGTYWLGINELTKPNKVFTYVTSSLAKPDTTIELDGASYTFTDQKAMAFAITGNPASVPEPTSIALLGLGLAGLVVSRRKSARN